jgi:hypothetical protein
MLLITVNGNLIQNVIGDSPEEDTFDDIVKSAEDRGDEERKEVGDIGDEAREDTDKEARDRDGEDENEEEEENNGGADDSEDNREDEISSINKFVSDAGEDSSGDGIQNKINEASEALRWIAADDAHNREGPTDFPNLGACEGCGMQIFVSPREKVNEIVEQQGIEEQFASIKDKLNDLPPKSTSGGTTSPKGDDDGNSTDCGGSGAGGIAPDLCNNTYRNVDVTPNIVDLFDD